jgi:hypothetical protein
MSFSRRLHGTCFITSSLLSMFTNRQIVISFTFTSVRTVRQHSLWLFNSFTAIITPYIATHSIPKCNVPELMYFFPFPWLVSLCPVYCLHVFIGVFQLVFFDAYWPTLGQKGDIFECFAAFAVWFFYMISYVWLCFFLLLMFFNRRTTVV